MVGLLQVGGMIWQGFLLRQTRGDVHRQAEWMETQAGQMEAQTKILKSSVSAAQTSADAALDQIESMKQKERGRLSIEPLSLVALEEEVEHQKIEFSVSNFGSTLVSGVRVLSYCLLSGNDGSAERDDFKHIPPRIGLNPDVLEEHLDGGRSDAFWIKVINPGESKRATVPLFWYPEGEDVALVYSVYIHIWGQVNYSDVFGEHHFFKYRYTFHLLGLKPLRDMDGLKQMPVVSVAKWHGYQDEENE